MEARRTGRVAKPKQRFGASPIKQPIKPVDHEAEPKRGRNPDLSNLKLKRKPAPAMSVDTSPVRPDTTQRPLSPSSTNSPQRSAKKRSATPDTAASKAKLARTGASPRSNGAPSPAAAASMKSKGKGKHGAGDLPDGDARKAKVARVGEKGAAPSKSTHGGGVAASASSKSEHKKSASPAKVAASTKVAPSHKGSSIEGRKSKAGAAASSSVPSAKNGKEKQGAVVKAQSSKGKGKEPAAAGASSSAGAAAKSPGKSPAQQKKTAPQSPAKSQAIESPNRLKKAPAPTPASAKSKNSKVPTPTKGTPSKKDGGGSSASRSLKMTSASTSPDVTNSPDAKAVKKLGRPPKEGGAAAKKVQQKDPDAEGASGRVCEGCNGRKAMAACEHSMCMACCTTSGKECKAHREKIEKRKAEDALLHALPLNVKSAPDDSKQYRRVGNGEFADADLEWIGETVVVWCMKDYISNKAWSQDTLDRQGRSMRITGGSSSSTVTRVRGRGAFMRRHDLRKRPDRQPFRVTDISGATPGAPRPAKVVQSQKKKKKQ